MVSNYSHDRSKKDKAIELKRKYPDLKEAQIAERLGMSRSWVRMIFVNLIDKEKTGRNNDTKSAGQGS
mgnify:CR=1 FL=1